MHILRDQKKITAILQWPLKDSEGNVITEELTQDQINAEKTSGTMVDSLKENI